MSEDYRVLGVDHFGTIVRSYDAPPGKKVDMCQMPHKLKPLESELYEKVRRMHCDRKKAAHECSGRVTLDRNGMTLQCPLCGDSRAVHDRAAIAKAQEEKL